MAMRPYVGSAFRGRANGISDWKPAMAIYEDIIKDERFIDLDGAKVRKLALHRKLCFLDVREEWEYDVYHIPGAVHVPLDDLSAKVGALDKSVATVVICEHGHRSIVASRILLDAGFHRVINLTDGMDQWQGEMEGDQAEAIRKKRGLS